VAVIIIVLLPIALIFGYTNQISVDVIEKELQEKSLKRLSFFAAQIDSTVNQLSVLSIALSRDPGLRGLSLNEAVPDDYEKLELQEEFIQKMSQLSATSSWMNRLSIYFPASRQVISSDYYGLYNEAFLEEMSRYPAGEWAFKPDGAGGGFFAKLTWNPLLVHRTLKEARTIVEVRFSSSSLVGMIRDYGYEENASLFFYREGYDPIYANASDSELGGVIMDEMKSGELGEEGNLTATIKGESYMINFVKLDSLGWYAVNYMPMKQVLTPILKSKYLFYASLVLMLIIGLLAAVALYKGVQYPIMLLLRGIQRIQTGTYTHRLTFKPRNEFDYVFLKFNEMSDEIQRLIEKVHVENIRFRDAQLKHLQGQINPHFLANSLYFAKNMIAIGDKEAATSMIMNLASYYRYVTSLEHAMTTLEEELTLIDNYLTIQSLRLERFHYETDVPKEMLGLEVPRLMIQPIVENAIIHGVEKTGLYGIIEISGRMKGAECEIIVDDNNAALADETIQKLQQKVERPAQKDEGFGVWNVNQRLHYQFGPQSGLAFSRSPLGGLRVTIRWINGSAPKKEGE